MSKFNETSSGTKTVNLAGGKAYTQTAILQLISMLFSSFVKNEFYQTEEQLIQRVDTLIKELDNKTVAKAAIYARTTLGMRSISHVVASILAPYISGENWAKDFYNSIIYRPDDMTEIMSYYQQNSKHLPNSMKKGFAKAFDKFDAYQIAKYRNSKSKVKLVDIVNLVHPVPVEKNRLALQNLVKGQLKSFDTWEVELSAAGQNAKSDKEKATIKENVWKHLISERKIGYFALLRNLRNIILQAPTMVPDACQMLIDKKLISKSLVLPFRFISAFNVVQGMDACKETRLVLISLSSALDISMFNVPEFGGETLVVCDYSGSMGGGYDSMRVKGTLFGVALAKKCNADFMIFGNDSQYINYNPLDAATTIISNTSKLNTGWGASGIHGQVGYGTNFDSIFQTANKKYDRIVIFSDMQGWVGHNTPVRSLNYYKKEFHVNPIIYSFDLSGYGTMQFPENGVFCMVGLSDKVFDIMNLLEQDKNALLSEINKIEL